MAENRPELNITDVKVSEYRSGIPLQGWESVSNALTTFSLGRSRSSRVTRNDLGKNAVQQGGAYGLFLVMETQGDRSSFVENMLQEAKDSVDYGKLWSRHYDYDGQGVFHKTSVKIQELEEIENGYLLELNAAYVGKEVEDGLAETLGVEQGLQWKSVNVELAPEGTKFRVNFDAVADRLQPLYRELDTDPTRRLSTLRQRLVEVARGKQPAAKPALIGEAIVRTLLATDEYSSGSNPFILGFKDGVEVSLNLGRVGDRFNWRNGNREEELWKAEGAVLSGPLAESYEDNSQLEPPSLSFEFCRYSEDKYDRLPAIDPKMKSTMNELAERIASLFRSV